MKENNDLSLMNEINSLKERLEKIERRVFPMDFSPPPVPKIKNDIAKDLPLKVQNSSNVLGYMGAACLIFAVILLIKLSVDSGWLTPVRQMFLAMMFGLSLTFTPFLFKMKDRSYLALLPAVGFTSLHLTVYGSVFFHQLLSPSQGLICTSLIGFLSLWKLSEYREETYAVMAIVGTYTGAFLLKDSFSSLSYFSCYLLVWNIIFSFSAIKLRLRFIIMLCAYFSLFSVAIISLSSNPALQSSVVGLQIIQMIIYSVAIAIYTIVNKEKLTIKEAEQFFPVYLFFYGHVFYLLDNINTYWATAFAVLFSLSLLVLLHFSKAKLNKEKMESAPIIYTFVAILLAHSIFFVAMNSIFQFATVAIILFASTISVNNPRPEFRGVKFIFGFVATYGVFALVFIKGLSPNWALVSFGFLYTAIGIFAAMKKNKPESFVQEIGLVLAHSQIMVAIYRLSEAIGDYMVSPLWVIYAFIILYLGMRKQSQIIAISVFPVIFIAIVYFLAGPFSQLNQIQAIISLFVMGALIYACGYFYKMIKEEPSTT